MGHGVGRPLRVCERRKSEKPAIGTGTQAISPGDPPATLLPISRSH